MAEKPEPVPPIGERYAPFALRMLASLTDITILGVCIAPLLDILLGFLVPYAPLSKTLGEKLASTAALSPEEIVLVHEALLRGYIFIPAQILCFSLLLLFCWHYWAATPGKKLFRLHIVDAIHGQRPCFRQYLLRLAGYGLSLLSIGIGLIWAQFHPRRQSWADLLSGTSVIQMKKLTLRQD